MVAVIVTSVVMGVLLTLAWLTAIGSRRRGSGVAGAAAAGLFFPVTWTVWYVSDEHPYRRPRTVPESPARSVATPSHR